MRRDEQLTVLGYLIARHEQRAVWGKLAPEAFPLDDLTRWGLSREMPDEELGLVAAAFAHYVRSHGDIPEVRGLQMRAELERVKRDNPKHWGVQ